MHSNCFSFSRDMRPLLFFFFVSMITAKSEEAAWLVKQTVFVRSIAFSSTTKYFRNLSNIRRMDQSRSQSMSHLNSPSISRLTNQSSSLTPSKSSDSMMGKIGSYIFNWWFIKFTFYYDWPNLALNLSKVALRTWEEMIFDELTICFIFELTN